MMSVYDRLAAQLYVMLAIEESRAKPLAHSRRLRIRLKDEIRYYLADIATPKGEKQQAMGRWDGRLEKIGGEGARARLCCVVPSNALLLQ